MKNATEFSISDLSIGKKPDYINQIWLAIMQMDKYSLIQLLDDNIDYEDIGKQEFIEKLNDTFIELKTKGDSELYLDLDTCNGCEKGKPVCKFIGNNSGTKFSLFFDFKKNRITDIFHCTWYGCDDESDMPF